MDEPQLISINSTEMKRSLPFLPRPTCLRSIPGSMRAGTFIFSCEDSRSGLIASNRSVKQSQKKKLVGLDVLSCVSSLFFIIVSQFASNSLMFLQLQ